MVALKVLPAQDRLAARVWTEYQVLLGIDHPRIVRVLDVGRDEGWVFLAMEPLDGRPAQVHARSTGRPGNPRRTAEAVRVVRAVAEGLDVLHGRGILHRDVKSSNVLVLRDGGVRLLDLGVARFGPQDGIEGGTQAYASPEQRRGEVQDPRSDLYGLGVLLHRMITGHLVTETVEVLRSELSFLGVGRGLGELLLALLAPERADRPPDARTVVSALEPWVPDDPTAPPSPRWGVMPPIGWERPLEAVETWVRRIVPGALLLLEGPPGSGKRRLLDTAVNQARAQGARVVRLEASEGFAHGILGETLLALPRHRRVHPSGEGDPGPEARQVTAVAEALRGLVGGSAVPGIVAVSDLDGASPADRDALARLGRGVRDRGIPVGFLVTTERAGTLALEPEVDVVGVPPLEGRGTSCFVRAMLGGREPDPSLVGLLHREASGRPGTVGDRIEGIVSAGLLVPAALASGRTCWMPRRSTDLEGPPGPFPEARLADGHVGRAVEALSHELAVEPAGVALADRAAAASALGTALAWQGRWSEASTLLYRELGLQQCGGRVLDLVDLHLVLAAVETDLERLGFAREHLEDVEVLLAGRDLGARAARLEVARCRVALAMGDADLSARAEAACAQARSSGSGPLLAEAAGLAALAWARRGATGRAVAAADDAVAAAAGHLPLLARACARRHEALGGDPDATFAPVLVWLAKADVPALEMPWRLARLEAARRVGAPEAACSALVEARACLDRIHGRLATGDRDAFARHPWGRALLARA